MAIVTAPTPEELDAAFCLEPGDVVPTCMGGLLSAGTQALG